MFFYRRGSRNFFQGGWFQLSPKKKCHTCCYTFTGSRFSRSHQKDRPIQLPFTIHIGMVSCWGWDRGPVSKQVRHNKNDLDPPLCPKFLSSDNWPNFTALHGDMSIWLIDYLRFYVPFKNFSLIWRPHQCRWRAAKFRPMLGAQGLLSREGSLSSMDPTSKISRGGGSWPPVTPSRSAHVNTLQKWIFLSLLSFFIVCFELRLHDYRTISSRIVCKNTFLSRVLLT
jgi:hypothetical protein